MHSHGLVLALLATVLLGPSPTTAIRSPWGEIRVKHEWNDIPDNWVTLGRPPNGSTIDLHIALKPNRENALINALHEVSQPGSPKYGAHLTREQIADLVAPHPDTLKLVSSWLKHNRMRSSSISATHGGGWLTVSGVPVAQANELLAASYQFYHHSGSNETILRTVGYALPTGLHSHVQTIAPTTAFTSTRLLEQTPRSRSDGAAANLTLGGPVNISSREVSYVYPSYLRSVYGTTEYIPVSVDRNRLAIVGFDNDYPRTSDLEDFMDNFDKVVGATFEEMFDTTFAYMPVNPDVDPFHPAERASFRTQYSVAISYPTPVTYYIVGGHPPRMTDRGWPSPDDPYLGWLNYMISLESVPQTISIGYNVHEYSIPQEYAAQLCFLFGVLGARGATVLTDSGNNGVGLGSCQDASGYVHFYTNFPASCPFVTSVGGTTGNPPEVATKYSGGGFSIHFSRPAFQGFAVAAFLLNLGTKYAGLYNHNGRGVPDIAVQSSEYIYVFANKAEAVNGTGCATSTAAGIIALLNDYQLSQGRSTLGWLNPWLYGSGWSGFGLNDVTYGNNPGCNTLGFNATIGWDPITGLGSLNFQRLLELLPVSSLQAQQSAPPQ